MAASSPFAMRVDAYITVPPDTVKVFPVTAVTCAHTGRMMSQRQASMPPPGRILHVFANVSPRLLQQPKSRVIHAPGSARAHNCTRAHARVHTREIEDYTHPCMHAHTQAYRSFSIASGIDTQTTCTSWPPEMAAAVHTINTSLR